MSWCILLSWCLVPKCFGITHIICLHIKLRNTLWCKGYKAAKMTQVINKSHFKAVLFHQFSGGEQCVSFSTRTQLVCCCILSIVNNCCAYLFARISSFRLIRRTFPIMFWRWVCAWIPMTLRFVIENLFFCNTILSSNFFVSRYPHCYKSCQKLCITSPDRNFSHHKLKITNVWPWWYYNVCWKFSITCSCLPANKSCFV